MDEPVYINGVPVPARLVYWVIVAGLLVPIVPLIFAWIQLVKSHAIAGRTSTVVIVSLLLTTASFGLFGLEALRNETIGVWHSGIRNVVILLNCLLAVVSGVAGGVAGGPASLRIATLLAGLFVAFAWLYALVIGQLA